MRSSSFLCALHFSLSGRKRENFHLLLKTAMPEIKMRPNHQITLPVSVVRAANLQADDRMQVEYLNGVIVITPRSASTVSVDALSFAGIGKGLWGDTPQALNDSIRSI
jgi:hypothetical protein